MLRDIGSWWKNRMLEIGAGLRILGVDCELFFVSFDTTLSDTAADIIKIERQRPRGRQLIGVFPRQAGLSELKRTQQRSSKLILSSNADVIVRDLTIPLMSETESENYIKHEIDKLTPFLPEDIIWDWQMRYRDKARGKLVGALIVLPRVLVLSQLKALSDADLPPFAIEFPSLIGHHQPLPLERPDLQLKRRDRRSGIAIICSAVAITVIGAAAPAVRTLWQFTSISEHIELLRPQLDVANHLKGQIQSTMGIAASLMAARPHVADALTALSAVTEDLSDEAYVTQYAYNQGRINIECRSSVAATHILTSFAADMRLKDAAFTAPVTHDVAGNELFSIQMRWVQ